MLKREGPPEAGLRFLSAYYGRTVIVRIPYNNPCKFVALQLNFAPPDVVIELDAIGSA